MYIPDDIDRRLRAEYAPGEVIQILSGFDDLHRTAPGTGARVLRCIVHLAGGNVQRVLDLIENARTDWRDVILWAEYDERGKTKLRDFNNPF